jgi:hypothetical protein
MTFKTDFKQLQFVLDQAIKHNVSLSIELDPHKAMINYELNQKRYYQNSLKKAIQKVKNSSLRLKTIIPDSALGNENMEKLLDLLPRLETKDIEELKKVVKKIEMLLKYVDLPSEQKETFVKIPKNIPSEIRSDIILDLEELDRCYKNKCYRSAIILCGRVLETALHRKYYDATGFDILEKSPGIGLGNLIAKLKEKEVNLDPALTNQIHLINQVRIFSVHKKKEAFNPSEQQTQAMILYTLDVLDKIFNS